MYKPMALGLCMLFASVSASAEDVIFYGKSPIATPKGTFFPDGNGGYFGPVRTTNSVGTGGYFNRANKEYYFYDEMQGGFVRYQGKYISDIHGSYFTLDYKPIAIGSSVTLNEKTKQITAQKDGAIIYSNKVPESVAVGEGRYGSLIEQ